MKSITEFEHEKKDADDILGLVSGSARELQQPEAADAGADNADDVADGEMDRPGRISEAGIEPEGERPGAEDVRIRMTYS